MRPPDLQDMLPGSAEEGARRLALMRLDAVGQALPRLDDPSDEEALHDVRVAVRRLRSALRAWRPWLGRAASRKMRTGLRDLQQLTGGGRDAEVARTWLAKRRADLGPTHRRALDAMVRTLSEVHGSALDHARADVRAGVEDLSKRLRRRLSHMRVMVPPRTPTGAATLAGAAAVLIRAAAEETAGRLEEAAATRDRDACHAARISVKRLRYLVEPFGRSFPEAAAIVSDCKGLQDVLGELQDARVMEGMVAEALERHALDEARGLAATLEDANASARPRRRSLRPGLLAIGRLNAERTARLFDELDASWRKEGIGRIAQACERLAAGLDAEARGGFEIERKYLLRGRPEMPEGARVQEIEQGWLPGRVFRERLRRLREEGDVRHVRTLKAGAGVRRMELEEDVDAALFERLWPITQGCRVVKRRHRVPDGAYVWEVDEFLDRDLWLAEVELPDEDVVPEMPEWLAPQVVRDVTGEEAYTNLRLAR